MKNFDEFYRKLQISETENAKNIEAKTKKKALIISIIILIIGIIFAIWSSNLLFIIPTLTVCFLVYLRIMKTKERKKYFKNRIINSIVNDFPEYSLKYVSYGRMNEMLYDEGEFEEYDKYSSEDLIVGIMENKYNLTIAEVVTEKKYTDSYGNTNWHVRFIGIVGVVELDKIIPANIKIEKNANFSFLNEKVELDSSEFEKYFDVLSDNKMLTMQILTADTMENLVEVIRKDIFRFQERFPEIKIKGNKVYVRIPTLDLFESKLTKEILDYKNIKEQYELLESTLSILKCIITKLDENI